MQNISEFFMNLIQLTLNKNTINLFFQAELWFLSQNILPYMEISLEYIHSPQNCMAPLII